MGAQALHGNPYDEHTLMAAITQAEIMADGVIDTIYVDRVIGVMTMWEKQKFIWLIKSELPEV